MAGLVGKPGNRSKPQAGNRPAPAGPPLRFARAGTFSAVSRAAIFDARLSATELRVLAAIASYANKGSIAWPAQQTLATRLGLGLRTVHRATLALERVGYLVTERRNRTDGRGGKAANCYTLAFPETASGEQSAEPSQGSGQASMLASVRRSPIATDTPPPVAHTPSQAAIAKTSPPDAASLAWRDAFIRWSRHSETERAGKPAPKIEDFAHLRKGAA